MMEKEMKNSGNIKKVNEIFSDNSGMKNAEALRPRLVQWYKTNLCKDQSSYANNFFLCLSSSKKSLLTS